MKRVKGMPQDLGHGAKRALAGESFGWVQFRRLDLA